LSQNHRERSQKQKEGEAKFHWLIIDNSLTTPTYSDELQSKELIFPMACLYLMLTTHQKF
jgi:hypothetical protein